MVRSPCCEERGLKKGPWTPEEDEKLVHHIQQHGHGSWRALPKLSGLNRCGKSCRLRWTNYLKPDIKRGKFSEEEEQTILHLHSVVGNKWSSIASHLPGRTDNEIKNFWNTHLKKKLIQMGFDPMTHQPRTDHLYASLPHLIALANLKALADYHHLSQNLIQSSYGGQTFPSAIGLPQIDHNNSNHIHHMVNDHLISSGSGDNVLEAIEAQRFGDASIFKSNLDFHYSQPLCHQMPHTSFDNDGRDTHPSSCMNYCYGGGSGNAGYNHMRMPRSSQTMVTLEEPGVSDFNDQNYCSGFWSELSSENSLVHRFP